MTSVYLDYNATTPLCAEALAAMEPFLREEFGNPLTSHRYGDAPRAGVDAARRAMAALVGADADDGACRVVFDSGGSEALNHALKGIAFRALDGRDGAGRRIVLGGIEHVAVDKAVDWLGERFGFEIVRVAPDPTGVVPATEFAAAVDAGDTVLATLHWANNELGTLQPVADVGRHCRAHGVPFVVDAVQAAGKVDLRGALDVADAVAFSGHKLYGPKGVGALILRPELELDPLVHGAQQEGGQRGGTHNAAGIVGLGAAARVVLERLPTEVPRLAALRDDLWRRIDSAIEGAVRNGAGAPVLPNTLNVSLPGCSSPSVCDAMSARGFAISAGAACRSGEVTPSRNLLALGASAERARSSVRISVGHATSTGDVGAAAAALAAVVAAERAAK